MDCSTCALFLRCTKPERAAGYVCEDYTAVNGNAVSEFTKKKKKAEVEKPKSKLELMSNIFFDERDFKEDTEEDIASERRLQDLIGDAMSPQKVVPPDLKIDDRDLPEAPNFYTWCMDHRFLNYAPYAKQLIIATHLFAEWCVHCSSPLAHSIEEFPRDYPVESAPEIFQFLEYGKCPKCGTGRAEMVADESLNNYQEVALAIGQRSGKSILLSLLQSYLLHRFLKLQNPGKVYGQAPNTFFSATMVGMNFARAKALLFTPLRSSMDDSPWFREYHALLDDCSHKYGEDLYSVGRELINYRHRNLVLYPASPSKRALRGDTRSWFAVDEIGWFPFGEGSSHLERAGAEEVYEALDRSLLTLRIAQEKLIKRGFNNIPNAYGLFSSSPQAHNDKIMSLMREFQGTRYGLSVHMASWEMSPDIDRDSTSIAKAFKANSVKAERDYGANPPLADDAFIPEPEAYKHCFQKKLNTLARYKYKTVKRSSKRRYAEILSMPYQPRPSILTLDAGYNNNAFGLALGRMSKKDVPQVYGMMEISPENEFDLDFTEIFEQCIIPIIDKNNVAKVVVDRWQSTKIIHDVESYGDDIKEDIVGEQYSLRREDFNLVVDWMNETKEFPQFPALEQSWNRVLNRDSDNYPRCFRYRPISHFLFQMATVTTTPKGVTKGQGYTDDLFRAVFLLLRYLYDEDEQVLLANKALKAKGPTGIAAAGGYSVGVAGMSRPNSVASVGSLSTQSGQASQSSNVASVGRFR